LSSEVSTCLILLLDGLDAKYSRRRSPEPCQEMWQRYHRSVTITLF
jgi:hypothetical protein